MEFFGMAVVRLTCIVCTTLHFSLCGVGQILDKLHVSPQICDQSQYVYEPSGVKFAFLSI